jgi:hypothetical protein
MNYVSAICQPLSDQIKQDIARTSIKGTGIDGCKDHCNEASNCSSFDYNGEMMTCRTYPEKPIFLNVSQSSDHYTCDPGKFDTLEGNQKYLVELIQVSPNST